MKDKLAIDVHAHAVMQDVEKLIAENEDRGHAAHTRDNIASKESNEHNRHLGETVYRPLFAHTEQRLAVMDKGGVDIQAVSITPQQYYYWADRDLAGKIVTAANEELAKMCTRWPDRFVALGTISLQHPDLAVAQAEHAIRSLKLKGFIISTNINGVDLADSRFEPVWSKIEELGAAIFIHPAGCALEQRLVPYYLSNVIGNPLETTIALSHLIYGGVLDRHPRLRICAAHGGGFFSFYSFRFDHGWNVRPEAKKCLHAPSEYMKRLWFDSIVYTPAALEQLIHNAGVDRVVLGTDFPYDMGFDNPVERLNAVKGLSEADRQAIRGDNAARFLNLRSD